MDTKSLREIPATRLAGSVSQMGTEKETSLLASQTLNKNLNVEEIREMGIEVYLPGEKKPEQTPQAEASKAETPKPEEAKSIVKEETRAHLDNMLNSIPEPDKSTDSQENAEGNVLESLVKEINSEASIERMIKNDITPDIYLQRLLTLDNLCRVYGVEKEHVAEAMDAWLFNVPISYKAAYGTPSGSKVAYQYNILSQEELAEDRTIDATVDKIFYDQDVDQRKNITRFIKCTKSITLIQADKIRNQITDKQEITQYITRMVPEYRMKVLKDFSRRILFYALLAECDEAFQSF